MSVLLSPWYPQYLDDSVSLQVLPDVVIATNAWYPQYLDDSVSQQVLPDVVIATNTWYS